MQVPFSAGPTGGKKLPIGHTLSRSGRFTAVVGQKAIGDSIRLVGQSGSEVEARECNFGAKESTVQQYVQYFIK